MFLIALVSFFLLGVSVSSRLCQEALLLRGPVCSSNNKMMREDDGG